MRQLSHRAVRPEPGFEPISALKLTTSLFPPHGYLSLPAESREGGQALDYDVWWMSNGQVGQTDREWVGVGGPEVEGWWLPEMRETELV
jgi:hypothetical protein